MKNLTISVSAGSLVNQFIGKSFSNFQDALDFFNETVGEFRKEYRTKLSYSPSDSESSHVISVALLITVLDSDGEEIDSEFATSENFYDENF